MFGKNKDKNIMAVWLVVISIFFVAMSVSLYLLFPNARVLLALIYFLIFFSMVILVIGYFYNQVKQVNLDRKILASFPETNSDPVIAITTEGDILYANSAAYRTCQTFFGTDDISVLIPQVVKNRLPMKENIIQVRYQFNKVAFEYNLSWLPQFNRYHGYLQEISHRMGYEKQLFNLAYFDPITQLPNRAMFEKKLDELFINTKSNPSALALVDIDHLQRIISITGHKAADEGIKHICHRWDEQLQATFDEQAPTIYRLGGGYFAVLFNGNTEHSFNQVHKWLHDIQKILNKPIEIANHIFYLTCCIGIVFTDELHEKTQHNLIRFADLALMEAKSRGDNSMFMFEPKIEKEQHRRIIIEHELRQAIINHDFILHYQGKYHLKNNCLVGCEALLRWEDGDNLMMPDSFIDIAEHSGLIIQLTPWLIEQACLHAQSLFQKFGEYISVAINLSTQQFLSYNLVDTFQHYLQQYKLPGKALCIEITETSALKNFDTAIKQLNILNTMGIIIALDDFGTGFSSLGYLQRLPIQLLKIDRRFISELDKDQHNQMLVRAIITLAHQFGIEVVAEGVESEAEKECLIEMGCDQVQGYLYNKPMSSTKFIQSLEQRQFGT